jgi:hypothetical protein
VIEDVIGGIVFNGWLGEEHGGIYRLDSLFYHEFL